MSDALDAGITRNELYGMLADGTVERLTRGLYRLTELPELSNPDLIVVALRVPKAVVCLISALAFHELTTQVPHAVWIALPTGARTPRLDHPPLSVHHFSPEPYKAGIECRSMDGVNIKIYNQEKSVADAFRFRNQIGLGVAIEALSTYAERQRINVERLVQYARIGQVDNIMRPYIEALL